MTSNGAAQHTYAALTAEISTKRHLFWFCMPPGSASLSSQIAMMQQLTRALLIALLSAAVLAQHDGMMHGGMAGMSMGNDTGCANLDICVTGELDC